MNFDEKYFYVDEYFAVMRRGGKYESQRDGIL